MTQPSPFDAAPAELLTLRDCLRFAVSRFNEAGLHFGHGSDNAWDEAVYLALHTLHLPQDTLEPFLDARLLPQEREALLKRYRRRVEERLPAAYLTHEAWLAGHRFHVDERVIIPRSFIAELLADALAPWLAEPEAVSRVLDMCTGSGCLAILAALAFPDAQVDAIDISPEALAVARGNVADYGLEKRVRLIESDGFAALRDERYDLILANPPYVNAESMAGLPPEYRHEPALALASGEDGLDFTRRLLAGAKARLNPDGILVTEIGHNREALETAFPRLPFLWLETAAGDEYVFMLRREDLSA
ncbi:MAG: 50S ribosomal protein L3 N(5)-glutamine methyltransferase [Zoogloeaceae bacterium]|nr:50S ribosomal protein L3 N(5)-glutamine methyltransferase [Zoogloeaceae bacterium]